MKLSACRYLIPFLLPIFVISCHSGGHSNEDMVRLLHAIRDSESVAANAYAPEASLRFMDSVINVSNNSQQLVMASTIKADLLFKLGKEQEAVKLLEGELPGVESLAARRQVMKMMAIGYLRIGERLNCLNNHSAESCLFPIRGAGIHSNKAGSSMAIRLYEEILQSDSTDLESRWLLNIAYMTVGGYPSGVPPRWLLKGLDADTTGSIKPFSEMAGGTGLDINNMSGGALVEDMDNDGNLDVVTSSIGLDEGMHYVRNNGNGTFTDLSVSSGLSAFTGGLHLMQTDYNNDGLKDIFVVRGAWKGHYGREPVSLLRNNGDGTFTDVTVQAGLLSLHPSQTAVWADFNNDGWLDVFVGAESSGKDSFPCELYMNNKDGTFTEVSARAGCRVVDFVKGVVAADYNNDGRPDIFVSSLTGTKRLLRNDGVVNGCVHFTDVSEASGLAKNKTPTFATWFWDYDNDGWPDILACNYQVDRSLAIYAATEVLRQPSNGAGKVLLFHNNHDGTFTDVSDTVGLNKVVFAMGCNFGDIDNDGYPDLYFGTGNPLYQSLLPNKLFRNDGGKRFEDVTGVSRTGNLQKGHGVAFADIDNDGDEDIYIDMGGPYHGDPYQNLLFINPGQNKNHWISLDLQGVQSNRAAIGARIRLVIHDEGRMRSVYKDVNSGSSFGANPLRQHMGVGSAKTIDTLEIKWPGSGLVQTFRDVHVDAFLKIKEGDAEPTTQTTIHPFVIVPKYLPGCGPSPASPLTVNPLPPPHPRGGRS